MKILAIQRAAGSLCAIMLLTGLPFQSSAQSLTVTDAIRTNGVLLIDLPAALQLAGARNLDIQIAREKLAEAKANRESSVWQFLPYLSPGVAYRGHENLIQNVQGDIIDVHKESYNVGGLISGQVDLGDAIYKNLASRQLVKAAEFGLESQRQDSILAAALGYFDLAKAQSAVSVAEEALRISQDYAGQVQQAVEAGVAFKGDALRAQVQIEKNYLTLRQTQAQQRLSSARLVQTLHLESSVELVPPSGELLPLDLVATNTALHSLTVQAITARPELAQSRFLVEAARDTKNGAKFGPLIPSLSGAVFAGGLGGGRQGEPGTFGESEDYAVGLGWRIGPGGLFDRGRIRAAEARLRIADLSAQKLVDEVTRQVTDSFTRWQSLTDQIAAARRAVQAADETLRLTQQRKEFAIGAVLENIQSEQELTRARLDYLNAVSEFNQAQYQLLRAVGDLTDDTCSSSKPPGRAP